MLADLLVDKARDKDTTQRELFEFWMEALQEHRESTWRDLVGYSDSTSDDTGPVSDQEEPQQGEVTISIASPSEDPITAHATANSTIYPTPMATPSGDGQSSELEVIAIAPADQNVTTAPARGNPTIRQIPLATPARQGGSNELEVNAATPPNQDATTVSAGENPTIRQTPAATPVAQEGGNSEHEINAIEPADESLTTAPSRAHLVHRTDMDTIFGQEEGRSELEINAAFTTAGHNQAKAISDSEDEDDIIGPAEAASRARLARNTQSTKDGELDNHGRKAEATSNDRNEDDEEVMEEEEDEIVSSLRRSRTAKSAAGGVDPEDDGSGEYIDTPDEQADSDDHRGNDDAVGEVQHLVGAQNPLRLYGARHTRPRPSSSANGNPTPPNRPSASSTRTANLDPRTPSISAPPPPPQLLRTQSTPVPLAHAAQTPRNQRPIPGSLATASASSSTATVRDEDKVYSLYSEKINKSNNRITEKTRGRQAAKEASFIQQTSTRKESSKSQKARKKSEKTPAGTPCTPQQSSSTRVDARSTATDQHRRKVRKESSFGTGIVTLRSSPEAEEARSYARKTIGKAGTNPVLNRNDSSAEASTKNNDNRHGRNIRKASSFTSRTTTLRGSPEAEDAPPRARTASARRRPRLHASDRSKSKNLAKASPPSTLDYEALAYDKPPHPGSSSSSSVKPPSPAAAQAEAPPKLRRVQSPRSMGSSRRTAVELQPEQVYTTTDTDNEANDDDEDDDDKRSTASIPFERPFASDTEARRAARRRVETAPRNASPQPQPLSVAEQDAADYEVIGAARAAIDAARAVIEATNRRRARQGLSPIMLETEEVDVHGGAAGRKWNGKGRAE